MILPHVPETRPKRRGRLGGTPGSDKCFCSQAGSPRGGPGFLGPPRPIGRPKGRSFAPWDHEMSLRYGLYLARRAGKRRVPAKPPAANFLAPLAEDPSDAVKSRASRGLPTRLGDAVFEAGRRDRTRSLGLNPDPGIARVLNVNRVPLHSVSRSQNRFGGAKT
jgi:hypothetical protein